MLARLRVVAAVTMLVGILALAAIVLLTMVVATVWAVGPAHGLAGTVVGLLVIALGVVLAMGLLLVVRAVPAPPVGEPVSVMAEPELWGMVKEAAASVDARSPVEVRLVAVADAGITEDAKVLGLLPGVPVLHVGMPLLQTLTRAELLWVLAHELGHFSERHVALSGTTRRGLAALSLVAEALEGRRPFAWAFRRYLAAYARILRPVWRAQELDADRWAAELSGPGAAVAALRGAAVASSTWHTFDREYASIGRTAGVVPQGLFAGYSVFLSDPSRAAVGMDRLVADLPRTPYDAHAPVPVRIERLGDVTATPAPADDERAITVLTDSGRSLQDVEAAVASADGALTSTDWDTVVRLGNRRRDEVRATRVMAVVDRLVEGDGDLGQAFHLASHDQRRFAQQLAGRGVDDAAAADLLRDALAVLVRSALVGAGHATYVLRWDRTDVVVDEAGVEVGVAELVAGVPGDPGSAQWLLEVLREEGISATWAPGQDRRAESSTASTPG